MSSRPTPAGLIGRSCAAIVTAWKERTTAFGLFPLIALNKRTTALSLVPNRSAAAVAPPLLHRGRRVFDADIVGRSAPAYAGYAGCKAKSSSVIRCAEFPIAATASHQAIRCERLSWSTCSSG
jgi:hypothetical protein